MSQWGNGPEPIHEPGTIRDIVQGKRAETRLEAARTGRLRRWQVVLVMTLATVVVLWAAWIAIDPKPSPDTDEQIVEIFEQSR